MNGTISSTIDVSGIQAIFFDMNGTLRKRIPDEPRQRQSIARLLAMLGKPDAPDSFMDELNQRYKSYTQWANEHERGISEAEIWTQWMTPELPRERIAPLATELMVVWRDCKGRYVLKPDAAEVIRELHQRGYRLGLISNTTSTADVPRFLDECGLTQYLEAVILSSVLGHRKPRPEIFWEATRAIRIDPARCAYLGNKISADVVGSRKAGFALAMIFETIPPSPKNEQPQTEKPDLVIYELSELLNILPARNNS